MIANESHALILDTRSSKDFASAVIPNSINIGVDGNIAVWVGTLITDIKQEILVIADAGREEEIITRLARVGYENTIGYLEGGINAWIKGGKETDNIPSITVDQFADIQVNNAAIKILDVRKQSEFDAEHITIAENAPLDNVNESMKIVNPSNTYYVHCASGYRSMIYISILNSRGYSYLVNINGGFKDIKDSGKFSLTNFNCPTSLL